MGILKKILIASIVVFIVTSYIVLEFIFLEPKTVFFNVGQGSSVGIFSKKVTILYDVGNSRSIINKIAKNLPFWKKTIDFLIISHKDKDHYGAIYDVLQNYKVRFLVVGEWNPDGAFENSLTKFLKNTKVLIIKKGTTIKTPNEFFTFLTDARGKKEDNEKSLVVKFSQKETFWGFPILRKFLLMGDFPIKLEKEIENFDLSSDILLVAHHGSKYNTSLNFIEKVKPQIAVIQVGPNNYGHPHKEVIEILQKGNVKILRTDRDGTIIISGRGFKKL